MKRQLSILVLATLVGMSSSDHSWAQCFFQPSEVESLAYRSAINDGSALRFSGTSARTEFTVRVMPHIVRENDHSGGISPEELQDELDKLTTAFAPMRFSFDFLSPDYIDNSDYYNLLDNERQQLFELSSMCNAMNIYFVGRFESVPGDRREGVSTSPSDCGIDNCDAPEGCREGVVIDFLFPHGNSAIQHEVGHYFGLWHTFSECTDHANPENCYENVDQEQHPNCRDVADGLCDTPADPGLDYQLTATCVYQGRGSNCAQVSPCRDPYGDEYSPDSHNFMSYAVSEDGLYECRSHFSAEQVSVAVGSLMDRRWELRQDVFTGQPSENTALYIECLMRLNLYRTIPIAPVQAEGFGESQEFIYLSAMYSPPELGAVMYHNGQTSAFFVRGGIYAKYNAMGREESALGYPVSDESDAFTSRPHNGVRTIGRYTRFQNGTINYISGPENHIHYGESFAVTGPFWTTFSAGGQYSGYFGYPISDSHIYNNQLRQDFEDGYMWVDAQGVAQYVAATQPRNLTVTSLIDRNRLSWQDFSNDETGFVVHYNSTSPLREFDTLAVLPPNTLAFDHTGLIPCTVYWYHVTAVIDTISSPPTNEAYGRLLTDSLDLFINAAEYYFDSDPGTGQGTVVPTYPECEVTLATPINLSFSPTLPGFHRLYLRYRDSRGVWSAAEGRSFYVTPSLPQGNLTINAAETFYDTDPGVGSGEAVALTADDEVTLTSSQDVNSLPLGFHRLYLRYRSNGNVWSAAEGRSFYVTPGGSDSAFIAAGEVFVDNLGTYGSGIALIADDSTFDQSEEAMHKYLLASSMTAGQHYIFARVRDNRGLWSNTVRDSFIIGVPREIRLVAAPDSLGEHVRLTWTSFPEATEYHVHYDSVATGLFTGFITIAAPDTSALLETISGTGRRYFQVIAVLPSPYAITKSPATVPLLKESRHNDDTRKGR